MTTIWRWDQGRVQYFNFYSIRLIAQTLYDMDGVQLDSSIDPLRNNLEKFTTLPFAPDHYKIWRNYKRVFECQLLATNVENRLFVTDICKEIVKAESVIDVDDYLALFIPRFSFPFPAFHDYDASVLPVFPFCAVLKYLIAKHLSGAIASIQLSEIYPILIGNGCTGVEPIEHYVNLKRTSLQYQGDQQRQLREMLIFLSQLSILKWFDNRLFLDISLRDVENSVGLEVLVTPIIRERNVNRPEELLSLSSITGDITYFDLVPTREEPTELYFTEGKKVRSSHLKIERSPQLRRIFLEQNPHPICDACAKNMQLVYPWTENILELHHILPLSSNLVITTRGTSLSDLVGLCPNCHKSIHVYYRNWLNYKGVEDFSTRDEATHLYQEIKDLIARHV